MTRLSNFASIWIGVLIVVAYLSLFYTAGFLNSKFTADMAARMHRLAREVCTPRAQKGKHCSRCSLVDHCQPDWMIRHRSVAKYLRKMCDLEGDKS